MNTKKIAMVIGHDKTSPGAWSPYLAQSEYIYNSEVASYLAGVADIYKRPIGGGYCTQMQKLANQLNPKEYDLVIELHFNAFNKAAHGSEAVIYAGNDRTKAIGEKFTQLIHNKYCTTQRGIKEASNSSDRGFCFLSKMASNAIILEPFFGDNEEALLFDNPGTYAEVIKELIHEYYKL